MSSAEEGLRKVAGLLKAVLAELELHETKCLDNAPERESVAAGVVAAIIKHLDTTPSESD